MWLLVIQECRLRFRLRLVPSTCCLGEPPRLSPNEVNHSTHVLTCTSWPFKAELAGDLALSHMVAKHI